MAEQPPLTLRVFPAAEPLAAAVAAALIDRIGAAQRAGRVPAICLTGGTIAAAIHAHLGELGRSAHVDWSRVDFWWGDERYVPQGAPERNDTEVLATLQALGVPATRLHAMPASTPEGLDAAAMRYDEELRAADTDEFEVLMLGIGPDGHIASLFPGRPELVDNGRIAVAVRDSPKPPPERISLTLTALNQAREVWFVASGEGKADAVAAAQRHGAVAELPARGVRGRETTLWWIDEAAAARL
ncbi:6-phosphogluconolactonase [Nocardioides daejeonensis]|uniref:6-phosphogluconolactonase n=1 Tax=Nocardioides daejeonensis TaxID=1046556 RepID=UPI000D74B036|nr:6-phosphogluconolactonase [Nocardioides daejeonensis]